MAAAFPIYNDFVNAEAFMRYKRQDGLNKGDSVIIWSLMCEDDTYFRENRSVLCEETFRKKSRIFGSKASIIKI